MERNKVIRYQIGCTLAFVSTGDYTPRVSDSELRLLCSIKGSIMSFTLSLHINFSISCCQGLQVCPLLRVFSSLPQEPMSVCCPKSVTSPGSSMDCQRTLCLVYKHMLRLPGWCYRRNPRRRCLPNPLSLAWHLVGHPIASPLEVQSGLHGNLKQVC